jgi:hypothetical protein
VTDDTKPGRSEASFCIPRTAIKALIEAKADAMTIAAYLTLACFTDKTGQYSTASVTAISQYVGLNKTKKGTAQRALDALQAMKVRIGKSTTNLVYSRDAWLATTGEVVPDGPVERAKTLHVLPTFGEELGDRVWFKSSIVLGVKSWDRPLKTLKQYGTDAARMLLLMQQAVDYPNWCAVPPKKGPWRAYKTTDPANLQMFSIRHATAHFGLITGNFWPTGAFADTQAAHDAVDQLAGAGFFYEVVMVLDKNAKTGTATSKESFQDVPEDAEALYELHAYQRHGRKLSGELGLAGLTAKIAGEQGYSVTGGQPDRTLPNGYDAADVIDPHTDAPPVIPPGAFSGKFAVIARRSQPAMVAGVYRPRFRPSNPKNAGVKDAWHRIAETTREWQEFMTPFLRDTRAAKNQATTKVAPTDNRAAKTQAVTETDLAIAWAKSRGLRLTAEVALQQYRIDLTQAQWAAERANDPESDTDDREIPF